MKGLARLPGLIALWVHMRNFSPVSEMRKGLRSWGRVVERNSRNKPRQNAKIITFPPTIALAALKAVPLQLHCKWDAYDVENTASNARRRHPGRQHLSRSHSGNQNEVFIWQNFLPAYGDPGCKNRDVGNQASPPCHKNTSKIY